MRPLELRRAESGQPSPAGSTPTLAVNFPPQLCKSPLQPRLLAPMLKTSGNQIIHSPASGFQKSAFVCEVICWLSVHSPSGPSCLGRAKFPSAGLAAARLAVLGGPGASTCLEGSGSLPAASNGPRALRMGNQLDLLSSPSPGSEDLTALGTSSGSPKISSSPPQQPSAPPDAPAPPQCCILAALPRKVKCFPDR